MARDNSRDMARTWRFDFYMLSLSHVDDVRESVLQILEKANNDIAIHGLDQPSFSYDFPQDDLACISGYVHQIQRQNLDGQ